jgi:hypothetical protein
MTHLQQPASITAKLAGQLAGADALGHPTQDQQQLRAGAMRAVQDRAGEAVEHAPAPGTLVIDQRRFADDDVFPSDPPPRNVGSKARRGAAKEELGRSRPAHP